MPVREAPSDGGTGEMDQDVDALEEVSGGITGVPVALPRATGVAADEADDPVSGDPEQRGEGGAHEARRAGDGDGQSAAVVPGEAVEVGSHLAVPVGEHRREHPAGHPGVDPVAEQGGAVRTGRHRMRVDPSGRRGVRLGHAAVDEPLTLDETGGIVLREPAGSEADSERSRQRRTRFEDRHAVPQ